MHTVERAVSTVDAGNRDPALPIAEIEGSEVDRQQTSAGDHHG
jgi:hypothetical protein